MAGRTPALQFLKNAAGLRLVRKSVVLNNGAEFEFWHKPLVLAERQQANKLAGDDSFLFALNILVSKACYEDGTKMFSPGQQAELKHEVRDSDLQKLMSAVLADEESDDNEEGKKPDLKSTEAGAQ
jgi:hypothetical protein